MADEFGNWTVGVEWDLTGFGKSAAHVEKTLKKLISLQNKLTPTVSPRVSKLAGINEKVNTQGAVVAERRATAAERTTRAAERTARVNKSSAVEGDAWLVRQQKLGAEIFAIESRISSKVKETHKNYATLVANARLLRSAAMKANDAEGLVNYREQLRLLKAALTDTTNEIGRQNRAMNSQKFAANSLTSSMQNLARSYISIFAAIEGGRAFFRTAVELDSIKASLLAVSGDVAQAGRDFEFLKSTSLELGVGLSTLSDGYRKIGIGARAANINLEDTREILLSGAEAATAFGLDAEQANLVLLAMGQIISKGRVSREELGRQMGEQFPAMIIGAKAMNMELAEFERLVESGGLSAEEFIVPFAKQLRETVRETGALAAGLESVRAEIERFKGAVAIQVDQAFAGRFEELTKFIVKEFTVVALKLQPLVTLILGAVAGVTVAVTGLVSGFLTVLNPMLTGFNTLIGLAADFIGQLTGGSNSVLKAFEFIGGSMALIISLWTGTVVINALTKILGLWKLIADAAKATFVFSTLASGGTNLAAAALALGAFGATALAVKGYNYEGPSTQGTGTGNTSTDKSTNTSIDKIEVNVTAPAGSDANQFGQSVAESMAATMGLSSAITN